MRKVFYKKVTEISEDVLSMAKLAREAVSRAVKSLINRDPVPAQKVIDEDSRIDDYEISIEEKCVVLQAEYQPLAKDLRYIHSVSNIIIQLERIGDLSANIAKVAKSLSKMNKEHLDDDLKKLLLEMLNLSVSILDKAAISFKESNPSLAFKMGGIDDDIDNIEKAIIRKLYSLPSGKEENIKFIADISLVARYLERVGDHSVNIGERVQHYLAGDYTIFHDDT
ncbi:MAG: phosphate signaling complex protein PhoU [Actinomycetota bacterium]|nr:phosphate signaling complex protein PhoU [Actinomycetota bacterium]